jgi:hypothetical protein
MSASVFLMADDFLRQVDPRRAMLVIPCSAAKTRGGQPPGPGAGPGLLQPLCAARAQVLAAVPADVSQVLPAWRRYQGAFYRAAGPAIPEAAAAGNVVIISGGYGVARADELIGWYDKVLRLADWPPGLLESVLISQARRAGSRAVVAFAARTSCYARLVRRAPWQDAGLTTFLVSITGVSSGAMSEVPRRLGLAFATFWNQHDTYPAGTTVEQLS